MGFEINERVSTFNEISKYVLMKIFDNEWLDQLKLMKLHFEEQIKKSNNCPECIKSLDGFQNYYVNRLIDTRNKVFDSIKNWRSKYRLKIYYLVSAFKTLCSYWNFNNMSYKNYLDEIKKNGCSVSLNEEYEEQNINHEIRPVVSEPFIKICNNENEWKQYSGSDMLPLSHHSNINIIRESLDKSSGKLVPLVVCCIKKQNNILYRIGFVNEFSVDFNSKLLRVHWISEVGIITNNKNIVNYLASMSSTKEIFEVNLQLFFDLYDACCENESLKDASPMEVYNGMPGDALDNNQDQNCNELTEEFIKSLEDLHNKLSSTSYVHDYAVFILPINEDEWTQIKQKNEIELKDYISTPYLNKINILFFVKYKSNIVKGIAKLVSVDTRSKMISYTNLYAEEVLCDELKNIFPLKDRSPLFHKCYTYNRDQLYKEYYKKSKLNKNNNGNNINNNKTSTSNVESPNSIKQISTNQLILKIHDKANNENNIASYNAEVVDKGPNTIKMYNSCIDYYYQLQESGSENEFSFYLHCVNSEKDVDDNSLIKLNDETKKKVKEDLMMKKIVIFFFIVHKTRRIFKISQIIEEQIYGMFESLPLCTIINSTFDSGEIIRLNDKSYHLVDGKNIFCNIVGSTVQKSSEEPPITQLNNRPMKPDETQGTFCDNNIMNYLQHSNTYYFLVQMNNIDTPDCLKFEQIANDCFRNVWPDEIDVMVIIFFTLDHISKNNPSIFSVAHLMNIDEHDQSHLHWLCYNKKGFNFKCIQNCYSSTFSIIENGAEIFSEIIQEFRHPSTSSSSHEQPETSTTWYSEDISSYLNEPSDYFIMQMGYPEINRIYNQPNDVSIERKMYEVMCKNETANTDKKMIIFFTCMNKATNEEFLHGIAHVIKLNHCSLHVKWLLLNKGGIHVGINFIKEILGENVHMLINGSDILKRLIMLRKSMKDVNELRQEIKNLQIYIYVADKSDIYDVMKEDEFSFNSDIGNACVFFACNKTQKIHGLAKLTKFGNTNVHLRVWKSQVEYHVGNLIAKIHPKDEFIIFQKGKNILDEYSKFLQETNIFKQSNSLQRLKMPSPLKNLGNSCYMNAIIQCLKVCFDPHLNEMEKLNPNDQSISKYLLDLLGWMGGGDDVIRDATDFVNCVFQSCNEKFKTFRQEDALEFLMYLLNTMKKELDNRQNNKIKEMFFGEMITKVKYDCSDGHSDDIRQPFCVLMLSMSEGALQDIGRCVKHSTLDGCLENFVKESKLDEMLCLKCHKLFKGSQRVQLSSTPPYLIINVNRYSFERSTKTSYNLKFPLDKFEVPLDDGSKNTYKLIAYCTHTGSTIHFGHYKAFVRREEDDTWFECNDNIIRKSNQEINSMIPIIDKTKCFTSEEVSLLFYKKIQ